ncbi:hypothetical protein DFJ73DRAFT_228429 [Zopfochytrium polystomum]|nr:hypothetical protein DFJ73DRAFT_228429 [Zopfochytrium polystomum]
MTTTTTTTTTSATLKLVTAATLGLFSGSALYMSAVEHPARLANPPQGIRLFKATIIPASVMQGSLSLTYMLVGAVTGVLTKDPEWFIPTVVGLAISALTLGWILPINNKMLALPESSTDLAVDGSGNVEKGKAMLQRWGRLHWGRSLISSCALVYMINKLVKGQ